MSATTSASQQLPQVVILGAGYAGQLTANRLTTRGVRARITVVDASEHFVERIRLHQVAAGQTLRTIPMTGLLPSGVHFCHGRATRIETRARRLEVHTPAGPVSLAYDWLVYALGSLTDMDSIPGVRAHAHALNSPAEAERIALEVEALARTGGRVLIVGGGLTGIEAATELAERWPGLEVELLTAGLISEGLSQAGVDHLQAAFDRLGITLIERARVRELQRGAAVLEDGPPRSFDLCLWAAGFRMPGLAREAGLPVNSLGQLLVDSDLRVRNHPTILAAGDAAELHAFQGGSLRMACASAMPSGAHVGDNLARLLRNEAPHPFRFGFTGRCISLGRRDGIVQTAYVDDSPRSLAFTGRTGAVLKEMVCRYTIAMIKAERTVKLPLWQWLKPKGWKQLPAGEGRPLTAARLPSETEARPAPLR